MTSQTTHTDPVILEMRSITKEFPGVKALSNVNLRVKAGEIHAICGENGAGKSTLMKVLSGVYPYGSYDGDIVYQGQVQQFRDIRASEHAGIVIIHQELALIPELSIMENIFLGNEPTKKGITSIIISHKLNEIEQVADSITIIRDGKSIETLDVKKDGVDEDRIIKGMVGRTLESRFPDHTPKIGEVFFEVKDWTVGHPNVQDRLICKNSNFYVRRGEIVGFAGLMGAGRTELARSVFGRSYGRFIDGHIYKDGKEVVLKNVRQAIDAGLGYVTEDRKSLGLNLLDDIKTTTVAANLRKISHNFVVDANQEFTVAEQYRKSLRTKTPSVEEGVAKLSGGNQQKVVLAKWMFTDPELLILDEPTRGIDVGAKYEIYGIIQQLANQGKGVIVISSELPELLGLSDRIYTIFEGAITGVLNKEEASQESLMKLMTSATRKAA